MTDETTTNLVEADDTQAGEPDGTEGFETGVEQESGESELEEGEEAEEVSSDDDSEEIEVDGVKHSIPKALKPAFMMQVDYTRKTQELADARKAFDAERGSFQQADAAEMNARGQLAAFDQQIARYQNIDWQAWARESPFDAQEARYEYDGLKEGRDDLAGKLSQHIGQRTLATQQETAKRIEEGRAVLARDIKDWSPQLAETLLETGVKQYGFDRAEIEEFTDPRMVKVLHDAHQFRLLQAKQAKAAKLAKGQEVVPIQTLKGASGKAPVSGSTRDFPAFERMANKSKT